MNRYLRISFGISMVAVGWGFFHPTAISPSDHFSNSRNVAAASTEIHAVQKITSPQKPTPLAVKSVQAEERLETELKFQRFYEIQKKTFRTEEDERVIAEILKESQWIENAVAIFLSPQRMTAPQVHGGIDLLLEALKSDQKNLAEQVILSIIGDPQIEDESLNFEYRERMAGIKAELMYHASSIETETFKKFLPGPVSEKILNNVVEAQTQNIMESEIERQEYVTNGAR
ncbi:MAG: hypothetical protein A2622_14055 [Bdellovibrionales bacterium RIFCSPHIGHO2_01_FULL_40_29]|nr:MAG: hypothetical protein A2622_14055 [Bdellovibrionales bacterium RIFCSPHIGHO2_01_FULL_40_29]OFZ33644.1 MAG: hypothetical protein A3D17_11665 [Bdellovibrionales bacterium RIFCSPHIGHO2_02_FULL_40_15]